MSELHWVYLSLGSNIEPAIHLLQALEQLQALGTIETISHAWESESVGAAGPNYLNACVLLATPLPQAELKPALLAIERALGRERSADKFAPRTIDIDIVLFDGAPGDDKYWEQAFVVVPLAEIHPEFQNPLNGESLVQSAARLRQQVWLETRPEVLRRFHSSRSAS